LGNRRSERGGEPTRFLVLEVRAALGQARPCVRVRVELGAHGIAIGGVPGVGKSMLTEALDVDPVRNASGIEKAENSGRTSCPADTSSRWNVALRTPNELP
jgi:predicted ATPase